MYPLPPVPKPPRRLNPIALRSFTLKIKFQRKEENTIKINNCTQKVCLSLVKTKRTNKIFPEWLFLLFSILFMLNFLFLFNFFVYYKNHFSQQNKYFIFSTSVPSERQTLTKIWTDLSFLHRGYFHIFRKQKHVYKGSIASHRVWLRTSYPKKFYVVLSRCVYGAAAWWWWQWSSV